ncbi:hypothetical protein [Colwellia sp. TT2012]|uniref:hypothetical protein n=1 Tax=Colwellia sp. TT2012 TaxID=1720342 RepID=UPI000708B722|nr:hypothetical protein [Colwellia sp. TT2012]
MNSYLITAGALSALASLLHIGFIVFGASWYRFFGAGEHMAKLAEQGSLQPTLITSGIVLVLATWSLYAFSAAGLIIKLPLMRLALITITAIYLLRGIAGIFLAASSKATHFGNSTNFWFWSSAICLTFGVVHLIGVKQQWASL